MKKFDAGYGGMAFQLGMDIVGDAIQGGIDRRLLRWRVSPDQGMAMFMSNLSIAVNPSPVTAALEAGAVYESGSFCGIPYAVDRSLPPEAAFLEKMNPEPIAEVLNLYVQKKHWVA